VHYTAALGVPEMSEALITNPAPADDDISGKLIKAGVQA
jgi:hypothetical protein